MTLDARHPTPRPHAARLPAQQRNAHVTGHHHLPRAYPPGRNKRALACIALLAAAGTTADAHERGTLAARVPGTKWAVTVNEGPHEPHSIGSYAVRVYTPHDPDWPYLGFTAGLVLARDGSLEALKFADIDDDGAPEIIVVVKSAGSGAYLSADALSVRDAELVVSGHVEGLAWDADPVRALRNARRPPPHAGSER